MSHLIKVYFLRINRSDIVNLDRELYFQSVSYALVEPEGVTSRLSHLNGEDREKRKQQEHKECADVLVIIDLRLLALLLCLLLCLS